VSSTNLGNGTVPATDTLVVKPLPPSVQKAFSPGTITTGASVTLTIQLSNPNATILHAVTFSDTFPADLKVAATPNASVTGCTSSTFNPAANDTTLNFTNGVIPPNVICIVQVNVIGTKYGTKTNTITAISSTETGITNNLAASASLTVLLPAPTLTSSRNGNGTPVPLTWTIVTGATTYDLYRSVNGGAYTSIQNNNSRSYTDSISNGQTLKYYVTAVDSQGHESLPSNIVIEKK
jgi:hypothetical protein